MRALRIFVVVMGVVLVVGFGTVLAVIAGRIARSGRAAPAEHPFATTALDLPHGARIEAITAAPNRLILQLAMPDGESRLVVVDLATGARLGTIELRPAR